MAKRNPKSDQTDWFEDAHKAGSPWAVDECVISCSQSGTPIPKWAQDVLAIRSWRELEKINTELHIDYENLPPISFLLADKPKTKPDSGGRGRALDYLRRSLLVGYIEGARALGLRGQPAFKLAVEYLLATYRIEYSVASAARLYPELRDNLRPHASLIPLYAFALEDFRNDAKAKKTSRVSSSIKR